MKKRGCYFMGRYPQRFQKPIEAFHFRSVVGVSNGSGKESPPLIGCKAYTQGRAGEPRQHCGEPVPLFCVDDDIVTTRDDLEQVAGPVIEKDVGGGRTEKKNGTVAFLGKDAH